MNTYQKSLAILLLFILVPFSYWYNKQAKGINPSQEEVQKRYDYLMSHVVKENIHPLLRPVRFSIGDLASGCGTLVLKKDNEPGYIVTANHLFPANDSGSDYYDYHVYGPTGFVSHGHISSVILDSFRGGNTPEGINDVAICHVGSSTLINRTSKVCVSGDTPLKGDFHTHKIEPISVTSVTTGEKFDIVSEVLNDHGAYFLVMLYESVNGESGSGFWDEKKGNLYVLSGKMHLNPALREALGIPDKFESATLVCGTKIEW